MQLLVLFDIDYTLLAGVKAHRKAFHQAFIELYGVKACVDEVNHQGLTDQQILFGVLEQRGFTNAKIKEKLNEWNSFMEKKFSDYSAEENIQALPSAKKLLEKLKKRNALLGLVTGNLEPIGWKKLKKAGLAHYFSFGAFGSDALEREKLAEIALAKAKKLGFIQGKAFLAGDTPKDIEAGRKAGLKTIGIATGRFSEKELKKAGADLTAKSLASKKISHSLFN